MKTTEQWDVIYRLEDLGSTCSHCNEHIDKGERIIRMYNEGNYHTEYLYFHEYCFANFVLELVAHLVVLRG